MKTDTQLNNAKGLLDWAEELLEMDNTPEAESWKERKELFDEGIEEDLFCTSNHPQDPDGHCACTNSDSK